MILQTSSPWMLGRSRSKTTRSYPFPAISSSASSPVEARSTAIASRRRPVRTASAMYGSSSAIRTRTGAPLVAGLPSREAHRALGKGKRNLERADNGGAGALVFAHGESVALHRKGPPVLTSKKSRHIAALLLTAPLIAGLTACSTADTGSAPAP